MMDDEELVRTFEAGEAPAGGFHHAEHVHVAWWYLRELPLHEAIGRFSTALRRFAERQGAAGKYHETMTVAYMLLIAERLDAQRDASWEVFAAANPDLLTTRPSILSRYYTDETLASERARRVFVMPAARDL
jgi:hypothetical protein